MKPSKPPFYPHRRQLLAGLVLVSVVNKLGATMQEMTAAITAYTQGVQAQAGRVVLEVAQLVDNGNTVPVTIRVQSPMSATDHVTGIALFNERNPQTLVATFALGPRAGKAEVATRIRLATSQKLVAVARMSDGSCWFAAADVVVTLAACSEGDN